MVRFINKLTGAEMFVADDRKDEYLKAGHKLAIDKTAAPVRKSAKKEKKK